MKKFDLYLLGAILSMMSVLVSCSSLNTSAFSKNASASVIPNLLHYDELTMTLDPVGITYTIDISTPEGSLKLYKKNLREAYELAATEFLMKYNCATIFQPQFTNLKKGKTLLRVTVYGFPARYKVINKETEVSTESVEETLTDNGQTQTKTTTTKRERTIPRHRKPQIR